MLTLKLISEDTEHVIKGLEKKHFDGAREAIEKVLDFDRQRREAQQKLDANKQQQNQLSKQIGGLMKSGKKDEADAIKQQVADLKASDKELQAQMEQAQNDMTELLLTIPNVPNDDVPEGKDASDNVVVKEGGEKPNLGDDALCHWDLCKKYNLVDFDLAVLVDVDRNVHIVLFVGMVCTDDVCSSILESLFLKVVLDDYYGPVNGVGAYLIVFGKAYFVLQVLLLCLLYTREGDTGDTGESGEVDVQINLVALDTVGADGNIRKQSLLPEIADSCGNSIVWLRE